MLLLLQAALGGPGVIIIQLDDLRILAVVLNGPMLRLLPVNADESLKQAILLF